MRLEQLTKAQVEDIYKNNMTIDFHKAELKPLEVILKAIDNNIYLVSRILYLVSEPCFARKRVFF